MSEQSVDAIPAESNYFMLHIDDTNAITCRKFDTFDEWVAAQKEALQRPRGHLFLFEGRRWYTTKGDFRHLVSPTGEMTPLFSLPSNMEIDTEGRLEEVERNDYTALDTAYRNATPTFNWPPPNPA